MRLRTEDLIIVALVSTIAVFIMVKILSPTIFIDVEDVKINQTLSGAAEELENNYDSCMDNLSFYTSEDFEGWRLEKDFIELEEENKRLSFQANLFGWLLFPLGLVIMILSFLYYGKRKSLGRIHDMYLDIIRRKEKEYQKSLKEKSKSKEKKKK